METPICRDEVLCEVSTYVRVGVTCLCEADAQAAQTEGKVRQSDGDSNLIESGGK